MTVNGRDDLAPAETSYTLQSAAGADGNGTAISLNAKDKEIMVKVVGATAVLSVNHEVSFDGGSTYETCYMENLLSAAGIGTLVAAIANPTTHRLRIKKPPGATNFRSRISGFVSGTVTVTAVVGR